MSRSSCHFVVTLRSSCCLTRATDRRVRVGSHTPDHPQRWQAPAAPATGSPRADSVGVGAKVELPRGRVLQHSTSSWNMNNFVATIAAAIRQHIPLGSVAAASGPQTNHALRSVMGIRYYATTNPGVSANARANAPNDNRSLPVRSDPLSRPPGRTQRRTGRPRTSSTQ